MVNVDPTKHQFYHNSFRDAVDEIAKGILTIHATFADDHWET